MVTFSFKNGYKTVFDAVLEAADKIDLVIIRKSYEKGNVLLSYNGSLLSYGNKIKVKLIKLTRGCEITIESTSSAKVQVLDWGTNRRLENKLLVSIQDLLE